MMGSLLLFIALGHGSIVEYDHGYFPGYRTGQKDPLPYVPLVDRFEVAGVWHPFFKSSFVDGPYLIFDKLKNGKRLGRGSYEIVTLKRFRSHAKIVKFKPRSEPLPVFDDSDLSVTIRESP